MDTVGKRLSQVIEFEAGSLQNFCDKYGFVYNSIQPISSGKRDLGVNLLKKIIENFPYITADWLLFGKGDMDFSKKEEIPLLRKTEKAIDFYGIDPTEAVFLKYFQNENVRKAIKKIIKEIIDEEKN